MAIQLPFQPSVPYYRFNTPLDGVRYIFEVRWNARDACWYFDLLAEDETPIISGVKLVLGVLLGRRCVDPRFPNGVFLARDLSKKGIDATYDTLGTRVTVTYFTRTEFNAVVATAQV